MSVRCETGDSPFNGLNAPDPTRSPGPRVAFVPADATRELGAAAALADALRCHLAARGPGVQIQTMELVRRALSEYEAAAREAGGG